MESGVDELKLVFLHNCELFHVLIFLYLLLNVSNAGQHIRQISSPCFAFVLFLRQETITFMYILLRFEM